MAEIKWGWDCAISYWELFKCGKFPKKKEKIFLLRPKCERISREQLVHCSWKDCIASNKSPTTLYKLLKVKWSLETAKSPQASNLSKYTDPWISLIVEYSFVAAQLQPNMKLVWHNWVGPTTQTFKALPDNLGSWFLVCNLILTQLERRPKKKMEDDLKKRRKKGKTT